MRGGRQAGYRGETGGGGGDVVGELVFVEFDVAVVVCDGAGVVPDAELEGGLRGGRGGGGCGEDQEGEEGE